MLGVSRVQKHKADVIERAAFLRLRTINCPTADTLTLVGGYIPLSRKSLKAATSALESKNFSWGASNKSLRQGPEILQHEQLVNRDVNAR